MDNKTLIVSMTSYPARIEGVAKVWNSILSQRVDHSLYHCVLVLATPQFPGKRLPKDLKKMIDDGLVELIWHPTDIKSHKKLMPVLKKYPDNPILVIDDDIVRGEGWLKTFIDDHRRYPNDIIAGTFQFYLDKKLEFQRMTDYKEVSAKGKNGVPGLVFNFARPANGCAGTLYPAHTFKDPRFFDEKLFMELSPTSDESWQFCFNIMGDMTMRQTTVMFDETKGVLPDTQKMETALYRVNRSKYPVIFERLYAKFPEFKKKLIERQRKAVISLTSYKDRFGVLPRTLETLVNQTVKLPIILVLTEGDRKYITPDIRKYVKSGRVEILVAREDLKPHKKYFYTMRRFPGHAVITVDDDRLYDKNMVKDLLDGYCSHPNCVIARRVHKIVRDSNGKPVNYKKWIYEYDGSTEPDSELLATGGAGTLYPPSILNITNMDLPAIKDTISADDIFLKFKEDQRGVKVFYVGGHKKDTEIKDEEVLRTALFKGNIRGGRNDVAITKLLGGEKKVEKKKKPQKRRIPVTSYTVMTVEDTKPQKKSKYMKGKPGGKGWNEFLGLG